MRGAVLFDLDDTLHDRGAGLRGFLRAQHEELSLDRAGVSLDSWTARFVALDERGRVWKDVVYSRLVEEFDLPLDPTELLARYETGFAHHVVPTPDLSDALRALRGRGWRTGIVTNGRSTFQRRTIAALGIDDLMDAIVVSEECGLRKPDAAIFRLALDRLDVRAEEAWFFGDDPVADVAGADAAGLRGVRFGPDGSVGRLADVPTLVGSPSERRYS